MTRSPSPPKFKNSMVLGTGGVEEGNEPCQARKRLLRNRLDIDCRRQVIETASLLLDCQN
eukprot:3316244-Amphidinium_carterae.1